MGSPLIRKLTDVFRQQRRLHIMATRVVKTTRSTVIEGSYGAAHPFNFAAFDHLEAARVLLEQAVDTGHTTADEYDEAARAIKAAVKIAYRPIKDDVDQSLADAKQRSKAF
jgi:hypothetical protein